MIAYMYLPGPERFDDVKEYVEKYQLYETALEIYSGTDQFRVRNVHLNQSRSLRVYPKDILNIYGDWLFERREFGQSALGTRGILYL